MSGLSVNGSRLAFDGFDVRGLAQQYGTPMYVYGGDSISEGVSRLMRALGDSVEVYYSIKANPAIALGRLIHRSGIDGVEIASSGELVAAIHSGFDPATILFAGPGKTDSEVEHAVREGVGQINAESIGEVDRINQIALGFGVVQRVGVRINLESSDAGQGAISTAGGTQKFGIDQSKAVDAIRLMESLKNVEFVGLHTMLGSQVLDARQLLNSCSKSIHMAVEIAQELGMDVPSLNFGGGLGVQHHSDDPGFDLVEFGIGLKAIIEQARLSPCLARTRFMLEPGRILVSEHGLYLTGVIDVKESGGKRVAIVDGGIHHALLPITANKYRILIADRADKGDLSPVLLGGPLCTSADQWSPQVEIPEVQPGDVLAMLNSGAYGLTASMTMFLSHGTPAEVLLIKGKSELIRERSQPEDLIAGQRIPDSLE